MVVPPFQQVLLEHVGKAGQAQPQHKMVGEYALVATLGSGSFATVYKAVKEGKEAVAIKAIARNSAKITKKVLENLELEISILKKHRHPNIVALTQVHKTASHFYLFLEYCAGGDLQRLIRTRKSGRLSEGLTRRLIRDLTLGLKFLGMQQLIHRDIKPQNLLLTGVLPLDETHDPCKTDAENESRRKVNFPTIQFHLKIADFGFARHLQKTSMADTLCGSPLYMAPEILQHQRYDNKADLWSVGTVLFEMITGRPPFHGENHIDLLHNIQRKAVRLPPDLKISNECIDLLRILLNRSPKKRAGLKEFIKNSDAFVKLGCNGTCATSEEVDSKSIKSHSQLDDIPEDDDSQLPESTMPGSDESSDARLPPQETKKKESDKIDLSIEPDGAQTRDTLLPGTSLFPGLKSPPLLIPGQLVPHPKSLPPLQPSPPGPKPAPNMTYPPPLFIPGQLVPHPKPDSSSSSDDNEFVIITVPSPISSKGESLMVRRPDNPHRKLENLKRTLNIADDVGRRAINVAKVGDSRAYLGIKKSGIANDDSSLNSLSAPMEGIEQESVKECSSFCSSSGNSDHTGRARTVSDADQSFCRPLGGGIDDCDDDEMPFAMSTPSEDSIVSVIPISSHKNIPPIIEQPPHNSVAYFREALMCYIKALSMLKSSVHTSQNVFLELSRVNENAPFDSISVIQLKAQCERSRVWLSSQFKAVLERADAANVEVTKDEGNLAKNSGASGIMSRQPELTPMMRVDELIYNHSLACGREGAVKQLLGHNDAARSCYRSAGLLAETLLMNPNIGVQDKGVLEDYVQGFLDRIKELDSSIMLQQSKHSVESANVIGTSGISSASALRKGSNEISHSLFTQGHQ